MARVVPVPACFVSETTLGDPDYADLFTIEPGVAGRSAEDWARAVCEAAAGPFGQLVWRGVVWLKLERGPDTIAGWKVIARTDGSILLEARGHTVTAQLVFQADDRRASLCTCIRYDRGAAALSWPPVAIMHRAGVPLLLRMAHPDCPTPAVPEWLRRVAAR